MNIQTGPTGCIVKGTIWDCNKEKLERQMRDYDAQLYLQWNPKKHYKMGCWEVRRRPTEKSVKDIAVYGGNTYVRVDYCESPLIHHVTDLPFLTPRVLEWLHKSDTSHNKQWVKDLEYDEAKFNAAKVAKNREDMLYQAKQYKTQIRAFKEMLLSGLNPARIAEYWNQGSKP